MRFWQPVFLRSLALSLFVVSCWDSTPSRAVVRVFDNGAGNNDWFNSTNWNPNGGPNNVDDLSLTTGTANAAAPFSSDNGGSITVSGASTVANFNGGSSTTSGLQIAAAGSASLEVHSGGSVDITGPLTLALLANGMGLAVIRDVGTSLDTDNLVFIGARGTGDLRVQAGAELTSKGGNLGGVAGATGTALIDAATWTTTGPMTIASQGNGTLTLQNGALVTTTLSTLALAADTEANLIVDDSTYDNNGTLVVGRLGTAAITVRSGGLVDSLGSVFVGGNAGSEGTVTVTGIGSRLQIVNGLQLGSNAKGTLHVSAGGVVQSQFGFLGTFTPQSDGLARVSGTGSQWNLSGLFTVGREGKGRLEVLAGGRVTSGATQVGEFAGSQGTVVVDGASSKWTANLATIGSAATGTLQVSNGGEVAIDQLNIAGSGLLTGDGKVTASAGVQMSGRVEPGLSTGTLTTGMLTIDGNYTQLAAATLEIEIGGTSPTQFDRLLVNGQANLGGTLQVKLIDLGTGLFVPQAGDSFPFFTGGFTSTFDNFDLPAIASGLKWQLNPGNATISLNVVDENDADVDNDGDVDGSDFLLIQRTDPSLIPLWQSQYGTSNVIASAQTVPEPSSLLLTFSTIIFLCLYGQQPRHRFS